MRFKKVISPGRCKQAVEQVRQGPMLCIGYHKRVERILRFAQDRSEEKKG